MKRGFLSFPILTFASVATLSGACSSSSSTPSAQDAAAEGASSNEGDSGGPSSPDAGGPVDAGTEVDAEPVSDAGSSDAASGTLSWYETCGDPVCQAPTSDAGLTSPDGGACPAVGSTCATAGDTCGTRNAGVDCGATLVCAAHDPKAGLGGCPISSREFKDGIEYVDPAGLEQLHDQTLRIRLATYNYKPAYADPKPKRLGFIIEDNPASPAVDPAHDSIELYGYLSMVVATMQVQEKEIAALKHELVETRKAARLPARR